MKAEIIKILNNQNLYGENTYDGVLEIRIDWAANDLEKFFQSQLKKVEAENEGLKLQMRSQVEAISELQSQLKEVKEENEKLKKKLEKRRTKKIVGRKSTWFNYD